MQHSKWYIGGLTACTKLGNGPNNRRFPDIMKGLGAIAEVEWTILQQMALNPGAVEARESGGAITVEAFSNCCLQLIPDVFICSISHSILENPVATVDGKANLALWHCDSSGSRLCPLCPSSLWGDGSTDLGATSCL